MGSNRVLVGAAVLLVGAGAAKVVVPLTSDNHSALHAEVKHTEMFDTSNLYELAGFADDILLVSVGEVESSSVELLTNRYSAKVEQSLRGLAYPPVVYLAQAGGIVKDGKQTYDVEVDQPVLRTGAKFLVAVRYQPESGFFNVLSGEASVVTNPSDTTLKTYNEAVANAVEPSEVREYGVAPRSDPKVDPVLVSLDSSYGVIEEKPQPEAPNDADLAWASSVADFCIRTDEESTKVASLLESTVGVGTISKSVHAEVVKLVDSIVTEQSRLTVPETLSKSYKDLWLIVDGFFDEIKTGVAGLGELKGPAYTDQLLYLDQLRSALDIAYAELGAVTCS